MQAETGDFWVSRVDGAKLHEVGRAYIIPESDENISELHRAVRFLDSLPA